MLTIRFERDPDRLEGEASATEPTLIFPLHSTVLTLGTQGVDRRLDRSSFALIPAGTAYALEVHSAVAPTLTLAISSKARDAARREYAPDFDLGLWHAITGAPRLLPRTRWVDELANRYLFERQVHARHDSAAARFLETELTKELFFLGKEQLHRSRRASQLEQPTDLLRAAQAHLEQHLFDPITVPQLARQCHTSESTLLRVFRRELGVAPIVYVRNRRLDEALLLLESRKYTVSEVAVRVGYANLSAFTVAFGRRFGVPPSEVKPKGGGASVLPPQGVAGTRKKMTAARKRTRAQRAHKPWR
jgi:AraC-like DNA-binding protein